MALDDKHNRRLAGRAARARARVRDRRRSLISPPADGEIRRVADAGATGTIYPSTVRTPSPSERVLKDGANNVKIGGDVMIGRLRGAKILTLTLEERATCPTSCPLWRGCYGNAMGQAHRFEAGPALERQITHELADHCAAGDPVLIRLHVLGDFYSPAYVAFWVGMLLQYPALHVYGFTSWGEDSDIGQALKAARAVLAGRWMIRWSGRTGDMGAFTLDWPTARPKIGDAVVCPEQRSANGDTRPGIHCGNCAACWESRSPIAFIEHG